MILKRIAFLEMVALALSLKAGLVTWLFAWAEVGGQDPFMCGVQGFAVVLGFTNGILLFLTPLFWNELGNLLDGR